MNILAMIFGWLNDQLLKMRWLSELVRLLVEKVFGLPVSERIGGSIHFFIYDTIKIFIGSVNIFVYGSFWLLSGVIYCLTLTW